MASWQFSVPREGNRFINFGPGVPSYNYPLRMPEGEAVLARRAAEFAAYREERDVRQALVQKRYNDCLSTEMSGKFDGEVRWELTWAALGAGLNYAAERSVAGAARGGVYRAMFGMAQEGIEIYANAEIACHDVNDLGSTGSW